MDVDVPRDSLFEEPAMGSKPSWENLDWNSMFLVRRKAEIDKLLKAVDRVVYTKDAPSEFVLVYGQSGIGKSAVIAHVSIQAKLDTSVIWISGKYDQHASRPYEAIIDATAELCERVQGNAPLVQKIQEEFTHEELGLMSSVIPVFGEFLPRGISGDYALHNAHAYHGFVRLYRRLLKVICGVYTVVLSLNDLQWVDDLSRDLIDALAKDAEKLNNFLFLGAVRTDDEDQSFDLPSDSTIATTKIEFQPLDEQASNEVVAKTLDLSPEDTVELGAIVHRRSGGNPYFMVQFLRVLHDGGHINFNEESDRFEWNVDSIVRETKATSNVVDLVVNRIGTMGHEVQVMLILASHLGFSFQADVLKAILDSRELLSLFPSGNHVKGVSMLRPALDKAVLHGLIEKTNSEGSRYKFTHDRVQQSAASLLPTGKHGETILETLGQILLRLSKSHQSEDSLLFSAVKLLTKNKTDLHPREMGELCLRATLAAKKKSAFRQAAKYADLGMKYLGSSGWMVHYRLYLELCNLSAELHFAGGNTDTCRKRVKTIEQHARASEDRFRAYNVLIDTLSAEGNFAKCIEEGCRGLEDLGVKVPKNLGLSNVLSHVVKTRRLMHGRKGKDLENLPPMTDSSKIEVIRLLGAVAEAAYSHEEGELTVVIFMIMLQVVLEHGICEGGAYAFAGYMQSMTSLGMYNIAMEFNELTKDLARRPGADATLTIVSPVLYSVGNHLRHEMTESRNGLMKGYEAGIRVGDIVHAATNLRHFAVLNIFVGSCNLAEVEQWTRFARDFFRDYKQAWSLELTRPWLQLVECLRGEAKNETKLKGKFLNEDSIFSPNLEKGSKRNEPPLALVIGTHYAKSFLQLLVGNYESVIENQARLESVKEESSSCFLKIMNYFHVALAYLALARQQKKQSRHYKSKAYQLIKLLKKHNAMHSPFITTALTLLNAELAALSKKTRNKAIGLYEKAIAEFAQQEFALYKAIALERAGDFCRCASGGNREQGERFLSQAHREYQLFGVLLKLPAMEGKYKPSFRLLSPQQTMGTCSSDTSFSVHD